MNKGCLRPLLISGGALLALCLGLMVFYWDTFGLMFSNMAAMGEGGGVASSMRSPDELVDYMAAHPEHVSLVAYDVGQPEHGIFYQADVRRPIAGLTRLLVLTEYARQVTAGALDPAEAVPLDSLDAFFLPSTDQGTHARALGDLAEQGFVQNGSLPLARVVETMMRWNNNAATDLLVDRLGRPALEALPARLALPALDPPLPTSGLFLSWNNHTLTATPAERLAAYTDMPPPARATQVYDLMEAYRQDPAFRGQETERLTARGTDLSLREQRALAQATYPQGTAAAYAALLARAVRGDLLSDSVSQFVAAQLERPMPDTMQTLLEAIGSKAGSFPGIISFVGYARRPAGAPRVVALLMEDVPIGLFYHLLQTGIDKVFEVRLMADDAFFQHVKARLEAASSEPTAAAVP